MTFEGVLTKMQTEYQNPIQYYLVFDHAFLHINQILGKTIVLDHIGYHCLHCNKKKKIFRQGYCYDCFMSSPAAGEWIIKPELSKAHLDIEDRDLDYEKRVQLQPHIVYLALSSEVKVGVTRKTQVPTRWIDQGAIQALPIIEVPNRYLAGITEVALKGYFADKTNWQKMLRNDVPTVDLLAERARIASVLPEEVLEFFHPTPEDIYDLHYPVLQYPTKVTSLNLEKTPHYSGKLQGVKAQYLLFEDQTVLNVRTYEGFEVRLAIE